MCAVCYNDGFHTWFNLGESRRVMVVALFGMTILVANLFRLIVFLALYICVSADPFVAFASGPPGNGGNVLYDFNQVVMSSVAVPPDIVV